MRMHWAFAALFAATWGTASNSAAQETFMIEGQVSLRGPCDTWHTSIALAVAGPGPDDVTIIEQTPLDKDRTWYFWDVPKGRYVLVLLGDVEGRREVEVPHRKSIEVKGKCVPPNPPAPPAPPMAGPSTFDRRVGVFYATDRRRETGSKGELAFGEERTQSLTFGRCEVVIPGDHEIGELEKGGLIDFLVDLDSQHRFYLRKTTTLAEPRMIGELQKTIGASEHRELLVFIHGFNVTFNDACLRAAQLYVDLKIDGAPFLYSWASRGRILGYLADSATVEVTEPRLRRLLVALSTQSGATKVHLVAHSMGNRALTGALATLGAASGAGTTKPFAEAVLAAPDVDSEKFRTLVPRMRRAASRLTLYASSRDRAIQLSRLVHRAPRAGEAGRDLQVMEGLDTIDATAVGTDALGHSYYGGKALIFDMFYLLRNGLGPQDRVGLVPRTRGLRPYWQLAGGQ